MASPGGANDSAARAFGWIEDNIELFDPLDASGLYRAHRAKAFSELSLLAMYYWQQDGHGFKPETERLLDFVERRAWDDSFRYLPFREPTSALLHLMPMVALDVCGRGRRAQRRLIERLIQRGSVTSVERVPFRLLDLRHVLDKGGFSHDLDPVEGLLANTLLGKGPDLPCLGSLDVYGITHTIFYLTDFGQRDPLSFGDRLDDARTAVTLLLARYLRVNDLDLIAELVMCTYCLGAQTDGLVDFAWRVLVDAQESGGDLPGPAFDRESEQLADPVGGRSYRFSNNYHTTLVLLLAALLRWRHDAPPEP